MTTDTPRTDAEILRIWKGKIAVWVSIDFAQQLERELAHSLENQVKSAENAEDDLIRTQIEMQLEIDKAEAEVERLTSALASCWHAANTYDANYTRACDNVMKISSRALSPNDK